MSVDMVEVSAKVAEPLRAAGVLQQNRAFLDFFWDLAKPDQDVRLKAVESLVQHLKTDNKADELEYTLKRLVDGLAHTREAARPGFSLALGQVLTAFEDVSLQSVLDKIKEKHNLDSVKKKLARNAMFGNLFGVLALHQSGRISKEPQVVLGCVQLLQSLSQHKQHLKDLPNKTMMDILTEIPEEVFQEVLLSALQTDLASAFTTPEQLQLLLVALQRFPQALKPKRLKKLLGSSTIINADNVPKLTEVLKMAAHSAKKELVLPPVALDLLKLSLKEDSFQLFWNKAIVEGMFKEPSGPTHYLSFRLLGSALPLLSLAQLKEVLSGEVMMHYGEHVVSAQKPGRFRLAPEMEAYVAAFLQGCGDPDRQLAVAVGFSSLTNRGCPVVPSAWRAVQHLQPAALRAYVDWLKGMFLQPRMDELLDFSTRKQKDKREGREQKENPMSRFRKWTVSRLSSIIDNYQLKKPEELIMETARFVFFHAFFKTKKVSPKIPETNGQLSAPVDDVTRGVLVNSFFGLLMSMHNMPPGEEGPAAGQKRVLGVTADGTLWIHHLVRYAQELLDQPKLVQSSQPLSAEQRQAWDSMLESVANLQKAAGKSTAAENSAFQQLFMLVGLHLFKAPEELLDIMKDLQSCVDKAQQKNAKKKKKKKAAAEPEEAEPEWVEVMVDILLSLLSQQSRHMRQVCRTVFSSICPHVTAAALAAIVDVLDSDKEGEEDSALVVTDDTNTSQTKKKPKQEGDEEQDEEMEDDDSDEDSDEDKGDEAMEEDDEDDEEEGMEAEEVDQNFRLQLMKVLQKQNALATEGDASSDEDLDDDAMMKLDKGLAALFSEQKKKVLAKKDEKAKMQRERALVRDFKIKVLDLVEVFVARQAGSPLVLGLVEPLLNIIDRGMSPGSGQQEQDFLRRAADIFRNQLCRSKVYCRAAGDRQEELHQLLDKLMTKTHKLSDSSVCLYYFSASLYVVKVLRGALPAEAKEAADDLSFMGNVDVERVSGTFREALDSFLSRRKSPLTTQMFTDLFTRFPVLCVNLLDTAVQSITSAVREHQQGQACVLVLRAMQNREVQQLLSGARWTALCEKVSGQLTASLRVDQAESKLVREKLVKALELCQFLVKHVHQQKHPVDLEPLQEVLQSLTSSISFKKTGQLEDTYWAVMKHFGVTKPKVDKAKPDGQSGQEPAPKKKKGFLPESKKRKRRNQPVLEPAGETPSTANQPGPVKAPGKKKPDKKAKGKRPANGTPASQPNPAKKSKTQADSQPAKKKKKKPKQKKAGDGQM
ncbi:myb-binding protein 1A-like protein [Menidia menidia]